MRSLLGIESEPIKFMPENLSTLMSGEEKHSTLLDSLSTVYYSRRTPLIVDLQGCIKFQCFNRGILKGIS